MMRHVKFTLIKAILLLFLAPAGLLAQFSAPDLSVTFRNPDQASTNGLYRIHLVTGTLSIDKNSSSTGNFGTSTSMWSWSGGSVTFPSLVGAGSRCLQADATGALTAASSGCAVPPVGNGIVVSAAGTLGVIAQVSLTSGGTNASLTPSYGGIVYSTTTAFAILASTPTGNRVLLSGPSRDPIWSTATYPATAGTANFAIISDGTNFGSTALTLASAQFANQGTTTTILHGNAAGNPSFAAVSLTADISGILAGTSGGTGVNNGAKTLTYLKNISLTAADDTGVYTLPTGTATLLATNGSGTGLTGIPYSLTGTSNQVNLTAATGNITFSTPQDIATASSPTFGGIRINGFIGINTAPNTAIGMYQNTLAYTGVAQTGILLAAPGTSAGTTSYKGIDIEPTSATAAYTVTDMYGYYLGDFTKGAGSAITNSHGFYVKDPPTNGSTLQTGFESAMTSGAGRWAFYGGGTAASFFGGTATIVGDLLEESGSNGIALGSTVTNNSALSFSSTVVLHGIGSNWTEQRWYIGASQKIDLVTGSFNVSTTSFLASGVGPHAIGGSINVQWQLLQTGTYANAGYTGGFGLNSTIQPAAGSQSDGIYVGPTFTEAGSSSHSELAGIRVNMTITNGVATTADAVGIDVATFAAGAGTTTGSGIKVVSPTAATTNWAINSDGHIKATTLTAEGSTKSAMCHDDATGEVETNPAATCTVSTLRKKDFVAGITCSEADRIVRAMQPSQFRDKGGSDVRFGFAAEWTQPISEQLVYRDGEGRLSGIDYERYTAVLTKEIQCKLFGKVD